MRFSTLDELAERYTRVSLANQRALSQFATLARAFRACAIDCLLLKGGDLIPRLYGIAGTRPLSDIDLLVRQEDLPALHALLLTQGFVPQLDGNPSYRSPDGSLALDVISRIWYLDDLQPLWERRTRRLLYGVEVSGLGTADLLVHLVAYSVIHRGDLSGSLRDDIRRLLDADPPDWELVLEQAHSTGLGLPLYHGLRAVAETSPGAAPPRWVLDALAPKRMRERIAAWVLCKLVTDRPLPNLGHLLILLFGPWRTRRARLKQMFFPSTDFLLWRYGASGTQRPALTMLRRAASLVRQGLGLLPQIAWRLMSTRG